MAIYNSVLELIGNTPIVRLNKIEKMYGLKAALYAKLEMFNPAGSIKDRAALGMITDAMEKGLISEGSTIIEPTSGNTGIGLALVARLLGMRLILTMPESMSLERRILLKARGAELVLTPASEGMVGAVRMAEEIHKQNPGSIIVGQFDNLANPLVHEITTAQEIWKDLDGNVDAVVAGVGTGGTITGIAKALKAKNSNVKAFVVEPAESPLLSKGESGTHKIQGIGANFIPDNFKNEFVDEILPVKSDDAIECTKELNRIEAIMAGISAGANLYAALEIAKRNEFYGKNIVVIIPDSGEHYLSTGIYEQ